MVDRTQENAGLFDTVDSFVDRFGHIFDVFRVETTYIYTTILQ